MENMCCCLILNYNDAATVIKLVSIVQNYKIFGHVLIVDNCSTDNSYEILRKLISEKIILIHTLNNGGYGAGNNYGIKYAKKRLGYKYVLLINPDVMFNEDIVAKLCNAMKEDKLVAAATCIQHDINNKAIYDIAWKVPTAFQYAVMGTRIGNKFFSVSYKKNYFYKKNICEVECVPGALILYNADIFCKIEGYDEEMFLFCEETTIGFKLKKAGYKTVLLTDCYYRHEHSVTINKTIKEKSHQMKLIYNNRILFMKKYLHANILLVFLAKCIHKHLLRCIKGKEKLE